MGGVYDPKTGQIEGTMHVPLEQQLAHYRSHPPSMLRELVATPIELDFTFDGHGEPVNAIFAVSCRCGSTLFEVYCHVDGDTTHVTDRARVRELRGDVQAVRRERTWLRRSVD